MRIARSRYKVMPWKNGLGVTAEIDRFPAGDGPYLWRLSQATIRTGCPFSTFPGYDRWLTIWRGDAIFLNEKRIDPLMPVRFSGDEATACRLTAGSVEDVGLIFDRAKVNATMEVVHGTIHLAHAQAHYLFDLQSGDTLKVTQASELFVEPSLLISVWVR